MLKSYNLWYFQRPLNIFWPILVSKNMFKRLLKCIVFLCCAHRQTATHSVTVCFWSIKELLLTTAAIHFDWQKSNHMCPTLLLMFQLVEHLRHQCRNRLQLALSSSTQTRGIKFKWASSWKTKCRPTGEWIWSLMVEKVHSAGNAMLACLHVHSLIRL